ncbi:MAG: hypothetical protein ACRC57_11885 [Sarcina sp.]
MNNLLKSYLGGPINVVIATDIAGGIVVSSDNIFTTGGDLVGIYSDYIAIKSWTVGTPILNVKIDDILIVF